MAFIFDVHGRHCSEVIFLAVFLSGFGIKGVLAS
jgi:hypothetical protein